jgi:hypothetical protein
MRYIPLPSMGYDLYVLRELSIFFEKPPRQSRGGTVVIQPKSSDH